MEYSDVRYLLSKQSVDDRALNLRVINQLREQLQAANHPSPRLLEIGAGVGTMVARLADWDVVRSGHYTLIDRDPASLEAARSHLRGWNPHQEQDDQLVFKSDHLDLRVEFVCADALEWVNDARRRNRYEIVTANAVLDLMDLRPALLSIWNCLKPGGLYWFSINFDGQTLFLPELALDEQVARLYHLDMDNRVRDGKPCGDSRTGRHLLQELPSTGAVIDAAGSSDWVVFPHKGRYPADEAYFLHHIVRTIEVALTGHSELSPEEFAEWLKQRRSQIDSAELSYIAHQLDVMGHVPDL